MSRPAEKVGQGRVQGEAPGGDEGPPDRVAATHQLQPTPDGAAPRERPAAEAVRRAGGMMRDLPGPHELLERRDVPLHRRDIADEQSHQQGVEQPFQQRMGVPQLTGGAERGRAPTPRLLRPPEQAERHRVQVARAQAGVVPAVDEGERDGARRDRSMPSLFGVWSAWRRSPASSRPPHRTWCASRSNAGSPSCSAIGSSSSPCSRIRRTSPRV